MILRRCLCWRLTASQRVQETDSPGLNGRGGQGVGEDYNTATSYEENKMVCCEHLYEVHGAVAEVGDDVDPLLLRQELYLRGIHDGSYLELQRGLATGRYRVTRFN